jgi:hypothetical protein
VTQPAEIVPLDVYTYTYTNTHTVTGNPDFDNWQVGSPIHGYTFTFDDFHINAAVAVDLTCAVMNNDGPQPGSIVAQRRITAGQTTSTLTMSPLTIPTGTTKFQLRTSPGANYSTPYPTYTETAQITWTNAPPMAACAYGASPNPSSQIATAVNMELILAVTAAMGLAPEAILFWGFMMGWPLIFPICSFVPTRPSDLVDADFIDGTLIPNPLSIPKFVALFEYGMWLYYCQCNPAPTGNPPPVQPTKPTFPSRVINIKITTNICSNADICSYLYKLQQLIVSLNISITNNSYYTPTRGYALGTSHVGLSGNGEIAVSGILGAFVSFTTLPSRVGLRVGDPNVIYEVGYITFGTPDGWYPPNTIDHNPWLVLPQFMTNVTRMGYSIPADCVLTLTELVPQSTQLAASG